MNPTELSELARRSHSSAALSAGGAFLVVAALAFAGANLSRLRNETDALQERRLDLTNEIANLETELDRKRSEVKQLAPLALAGLGHKSPETSTPEVLSLSLDATAHAKRLAKSGVDRRARVTVRYYPKDFERDLNEGVVLPKLRGYGFRLEKGRPRVPGVPTNAVWTGAAVDPNDVRLVVFTLQAAGLQIKAVRRFRDADGAKRQTIEIGSDASMTKQAPLRVEEVMAASDFARF
jgi:hypothetical protein